MDLNPYESPANNDPPPPVFPLPVRLVEIGVVIAILGLLVALLLPAVNSARHATRRTRQPPPGLELQRPGNFSGTPAPNGP